MSTPVGSTEKKSAPALPTQPTVNPTSAALAQVVASSIPLASGTSPSLLDKSSTPSPSQKVEAVAGQYGPFPSTTLARNDSKKLPTIHEQKTGCDPSPKPEIATLSPHSTNHDLKSWVQKQLALPPDERVTQLSLNGCWRIDDLTLLEPLASTLKNIHIEDRFMGISMYSPLWWVLESKGQTQKPGDFTIIPGPTDLDDVQEVSISFLDFDTALRYLSGYVRGTVEKTISVTGYILPNGKRISINGWTFTKGNFYSDSQEDRVRIVNEARKELETSGMKARRFR